MVKTVALYKDTDNKLKFSWWKYEPSFSKKKWEDGIVLNFKVSLEKVFSEKIQSDW